jgi:glycosyltransferase involved in cell wall biosynthesis
MRIGIIFTADIRLTSTTVRFERYREGFRRLGHDPVIVCTEEAAIGFPWADVQVPNLTALRDPELWSSLRLDTALVLTWLGMPDVMSAIRAHVRYLVSLSDSDGVVGVRVFPRQLLARMLVQQPQLLNRLRAAGWWFRQYLWAFKHEDEPVRTSARLADRIVCYSPQAGRYLQAFFDYHQEPSLGERVLIAPYPLDDTFLDAPMPTKRENHIVAIGRWDDPQKDACLLSRAIARYLRAGGSWKFVLIGSNGEKPFRPLISAYPQVVEYRGVVPQAEVADLLGRSQILLSTSRWESGPIVASEALVRGCSVIGPYSVPSFCQFCRNGCGTSFADRAPQAVVTALTDEIKAWEAGRRDPARIAARWKEYFTPEVVCRRILDGQPCDSRIADLVHA